jgi:hypothetical protein
MTQKRYPLTLLLDGRTVHMLWTSDEDGFNDHVLVNDGRVVSFADLESLRRYAREQELLLDPDDPSHVDLDAAAEWLRSGGEPDVVVLLNAWNLSWDVGNAIGGGFEHRGEALDAIYDKLFFGNNLSAMTPPEKRYEPEWSADELKALRATIRQGVALVRTALPATP